MKRTTTWALVGAPLGLAVAVCVMAACGGKQTRDLGPIAAPERGRAVSVGDAGFDDQGRCDFKGRDDREVSETAGPGAILPNVRRVYAVLGTGDDRRKVMVCREIDTNLDGVKDVVRTFNDKGEALHEEADANYDGKVDTWITFASGRISKETIDTDNSGQPDVWKYYIGGQLSRIQRDTNHDGQPDIWEFYEKGNLERVGVDVDFDGHVDRWDHDNIKRRAAEAADRAEERSAGAQKGDAGDIAAPTSAASLGALSADAGADAGPKHQKQKPAKKLAISTPVEKRWSRLARCKPLRDVSFLGIESEPSTTHSWLVHAAVSIVVYRHRGRSRSAGRTSALGQERLQKIIARAGVSSRRHSEELITAGRVRVNGKIVTELGSRADPTRDDIEIDGRKLVAEDLVYLVLHKPRLVVSTLDDPEGRPTVAELVRDVGVRVHPVGRLDFHTSGTLLLTNDGELTNGLLHPRKAVEKTYIVKTQGQMSDADIARWETGIELEDGKTLPAKARLVRHEAGKTWLEVTLTEGRNQQIRRMGEATGFGVMRLARLSFAGVTTEELAPGRWRHLTSDELTALRDNYGVPRRVRATRQVEKPEKTAWRPGTKSKPTSGYGPPSRNRPERGAKSDARDERVSFKRPDRESGGKPVGGSFQGRDRGASQREERPFPPRGDRPTQNRDSRSPFPRNDRTAPTRSEKPAFTRSDRGGAPREDKPAVSRGDRGSAPGREGKPAFARSDRGGAPREGKPGFQRSDRGGAPGREGKPAFSRSDRGGAPGREGKPAFPRGERSRPSGERGRSPYTGSKDRSGPPQKDGATGGRRGGRTRPPQDRGESRGGPSKSSGSRPPPKQRSGFAKPAQKREDDVSSAQTQDARGTRKTSPSRNKRPR